MDKILVLGAGKSSGVLIKYLSERANLYGYQLVVADASQKNLEERVGKFSQTQQVCVDVANIEKLSGLISLANLVISLLPPFMHAEVAKLCLKYQKHLLTASYVSPEVKALDQDAKEKGIALLMECGLDPGIDHMSAMKLLDDLKERGAEITSFKSYCGGLVAPESDDNPWGYKISWNPRNVVLAGKGTAQYLENGVVKLIPYHQLFKRTEPLEFDHYGTYEGYPNRDSLSYIKPYGLEAAHTFLRGTIRKRGFSKAWHQVVALGLTDDMVSFAMNGGTIEDFVSKFLPQGKSLATYLDLEQSSEEIEMLEWLGLQSKEMIDMEGIVSPADVLQHIIEKKWRLNEGDKDLVLMQHQVQYVLGGKQYRTISSLAQKGINTTETAMATTVGLPLAIATLLLYQEKIGKRGVITPVLKEIYNPVLEELKNNSLIFREYTYS